MYVCRYSVCREGRETVTRRHDVASRRRHVSSSLIGSGTSGQTLSLARLARVIDEKLASDWTAHLRLGGESRKEEEKGRKREEGG